MSQELFSIKNIFPSALELRRLTECNKYAAREYFMRDLLTKIKEAVETRAKAGFFDVTLTIKLADINVNKEELVSDLMKFLSSKDHNVTHSIESNTLSVEMSWVEKSSVSIEELH